MVEARDTHPQLACNLLDLERLIVVVAHSPNRPRDAAGLPAFIVSRMALRPIGEHQQNAILPPAAWNTAKGETSGGHLASSPKEEITEATAEGVALIPGIAWNAL